MSALPRAARRVRPNRTEVFFIYINGRRRDFEGETRTLQGARLKAAALARQGFQTEIVRCVVDRDPVTGLGCSWNESVPDAG